MWESVGESEDGGSLQGGSVVGKYLDERVPCVHVLSEKLQRLKLHSTGFDYANVYLEL